MRGRGRTSTGPVRRNLGGGGRREGNGGPSGPARRAGVARVSLVVACNRWARRPQPKRPRILHRGGGRNGRRYHGRRDRPTTTSVTPVLAGEPKPRNPRPRRF